MTTDELLDLLRKELTSIQATIRHIEKFNGIYVEPSAQTVSTPIAPRRRAYGGTHWTQLPKNKARVARQVRLAVKAKQRLRKQRATA